jgi:hypothetical protein
MSAAEKSAVRTAPNVGALALKVHANPTQEEFQSSPSPTRRTCCEPPAAR